MNVVTIIALVFLLVIVVVFVLRNRIILAMSAMLRIAFVALVALALCGLFFPQLFDALADSSLRTAGTYGAVQSLDGAISSITEIPQNLLDLFNPTEKPEQVELQPGVLEQNLYPGLTSLVGFIYRVFALIFAFAGLIVVVYVSYSIIGATNTAKLKRSYDELKQRIDALEALQTGNLA